MNITISGIDKYKVGQFAAEIRDWRKPEPYKVSGTPRPSVCMGSTATAHSACSPYRILLS